MTRDAKFFAIRFISLNPLIEILNKHEDKLINDVLIFQLGSSKLDYFGIFSVSETADNILLNYGAYECFKDYFVIEIKNKKEKNPLFGDIIIINYTSNYFNT